VLDANVLMSAVTVVDYRQPSLARGQGPRRAAVLAPPSPSAPARPFSVVKGLWFRVTPPSLNAASLGCRKSDFVRSDIALASCSATAAHGRGLSAAALHRFGRGVKIMRTSRGLQHCWPGSALTHEAREGRARGDRR
jgi:hypothetical protein